MADEYRAGGEYPCGSLADNVFQIRQRGFIESGRLKLLPHHIAGRYELMLTKLPARHQDGAKCPDTHRHHETLLGLARADDLDRY